MRKRLLYAAVSLLLLGVEVAIDLFVHDRVIRPYGGDVLVTVLLCCLVRTVLPERPRALPLYVFLFAAAVEGMQYLDWTTWLGAEDNPFWRVVLGSTFSWGNVACYAVGCGAVWAVERAWRRKKTG